MALESFHRYALRHCGRGVGGPFFGAAAERMCSAYPDQSVQPQGSAKACSEKIQSLLQMDSSNSVMVPVGESWPK